MLCDNQLLAHVRELNNTQIYIYIAQDVRVK